MLLLDCPIRKTDWDQEISERNGFVFLREDEKKPVEDAGPWEPAVQEIIAYQQLQPNWDGYGAQVPSREVLESAIGLAYCFYEKGVDPPHRVAPGVTGSVIFEWQDRDGAYTTVEIDAALHAEVMVIEPGKDPQQWTLPTD